MWKTASTEDDKPAQSSVLLEKEMNKVTGRLASNTPLLPDSRLNPLLLPDVTFSFLVFFAFCTKWVLLLLKKKKKRFHSTIHHELPP